MGSEWTSGGTRNGCYNDSCESVNVVGQLITKSGAVTPGTLSGTNFWVSESSVLKHIPSVSFNGTNYLVVFPEDTGLADVCGENGCDKNISAYLITTGGSLASTKITVNNVAGQQIYPSVAFNGANHLVLWTDYRNDANNDQICDAAEGTCADIYGQYISTTGTLVGSEFIINNDEGNQFGLVDGPAVNGRLFGLINTEGNMLQDSWGDVYGVFMGASAISGRVFVNFAGYSNLGVGNATVSLQGTQYSVSTDSNGNFTLINIPAGTYTLIVTASDMNTITQSVSFTGQSMSITIPPMVPSTTTCLQGDADGDKKLGLADAIYTLQILSGIRQ